MTFSEAVRDAFAKYAVFSGRSSRSAYWWFYLFGLLAVIAAAVLDVILATWFVYALVVLGMLLPNLAVLVRRLHDTGHSGWWVLISFVPLIGLIVLLVFTVQASDGPNQWGTGPDDTPAVAPVGAAYLFPRGRRVASRPSAAPRARRKALAVFLPAVKRWSSAASRSVLAFTSTGQRSMPSSSLLWNGGR